MSTPRFPFSAVVGHDDLRLALLLNAVHPGVGGVLVRGEKGTAKSTAVRALAALLPAQDVVANCRFRCDPDRPDGGCPDGPHHTRAEISAEVARWTGLIDEENRWVEASGGAPDDRPPGTAEQERVREAVRARRRAASQPSRFTAPVAVDLAEDSRARPAAVVGHAENVRGRPAAFVELPVGATEDRLVGSLDLERALSEGVRAYQPGLLAAAHRGVLYVDEVNLLHDHLVDLLLDAAAMGRAHVERDGVSVSHAARFLLVGTMNPEEGELRPQLLDRFGLAVEVRAARDVDTRVEVVRRRLAFEADPAGFVARWAQAEADTAARIAAAQARVGSVALPDTELRRIAAICAAFDVDGMRADLVIARAAVAHAAWRGAEAVAEEDVRVAARLALPHRRRRDPFDEPGMDEGALDDAMEKAAEQAGPGDDEPDPDGGGGGAEGADGSGNADGSGDPDRPQPEASTDDPAGSSAGGARGRPDGRDPDRDEAGEGRAAPAPGALFRARTLTVPGVGEGAPGRRSRARTDAGRVVRASDATPLRAADVHLPATVLAAAPHQRARGRTGARLVLCHGDLRHAVREGREGNLVLFVVDASGSMAARTRMSAVTGAVLSLLRDAYQRRDKVGVISFRAGGAELVLPPTSSVPAAQARLADLRTGGRTPLAEGLLRARKVLAVERLRDPRRRPLVVLLTDGRATVGVSGDPVLDACRAAALLAADGVATVVVDCESGPVRLGLAARVAAAAGGELTTIGELSADGVAGVVHAARVA